MGNKPSTATSIPAAANTPQKSESQKFKSPVIFNNPDLIQAKAKLNTIRKQIESINAKIKNKESKPPPRFNPFYTSVQTLKQNRGSTNGRRRLAEMDFNDLFKVWLNKNGFTDNYANLEEGKYYEQIKKEEPYMREYVGKLVKRDKKEYSSTHSNSADFILTFERNGEETETKYVNVIPYFKEVPPRVIGGKRKTRKRRLTKKLKRRLA